MTKDTSKIFILQKVFLFSKIVEEIVPKTNEYCLHGKINTFIWKRKMGVSWTLELEREAQSIARVGF